MDFFIYLLLGGMLFLGVVYILLKAAGFIMKVLLLLVACAIVSTKNAVSNIEAIYDEKEPATPETPSASGKQTPGHHYLSPPIPLETCQGPPPD